eukprot:Colp12_sorted_trinity150504_noHs@15956
MAATEEYVEHIQFDKAVDELHSMFNSFERDIIENVLTANSCNVEAAIDTLLQLSGAVPTSPPQQQPQPAPTTPQSAPVQQRQQERPIHRLTSISGHACYVGELPYDFLRIDSGLSEDEKLARLLQNEELLLHLQANEEFKRALAEDESNHEVSESVPFSARLQNMGQAAREKFMQLANLFKKEPEGKPADKYALLGEPTDDIDSIDKVLLEDDDDFIETLDDNRGSVRPARPAGVERRPSLQFADD